MLENVKQQCVGDIRNYEKFFFFSPNIVLYGSTAFHYQLYSVSTVLLIKRQDATPRMFSF